MASIDGEILASSDNENILDEIPHERTGAILKERGKHHVGEENAVSRGALVASIQYLARQVPMWVLKRLGEEILELHRKDVASDRHFDNEKPKLPFVSSHKCAMLLVDISGFTQLSTLLDAESLSKTINNYFHLIVDEISSHGGDVLKFAGDAVFAEWRVSSTNHVENMRGTLEGCVLVAAMCGARIAARCSDYAVYGSTVVGGRIGQGSHVIASLNVHCGVGVGDLFALHVGNEVRRENLVLGGPIDQVVEAEGFAENGEVVASFESLVLLALSSDFLSESLTRNVKDQKPGVIARGGITMFAPTETFRFQYAHRKDTDIITTKLKEQLDTMDNSHLQCYLKLLSLYVHPVSVANDKASREANHATASSVQERRAAEAELRNVCVLFIMPMLSTKPSGNDEQDQMLFSLLNDMLNVTTRELNRFRGHLRQYIVDDKGVILIATFGLRGSTFPGMIAERALPLANIVHNALLHEIGVENRIGVTMGTVYCGVVGGVLRHEYAALGPSVNLSARLMASAANPGILVDAKVRSMAGRTYAFNALPPVQAKGYPDPVSIFEPLDPLQRGWIKKGQSFVARDKELHLLEHLGKDMLITANTPAKMVFISGPSGMGKTSLSVHAIEILAKAAGQSKKRLVLTKHMGKEGDKLMPFSMFQSILVDSLNNFNSAHDVHDADRAYSGHGLSSIESVLLTDDRSSGAFSATGAISNRIADHLSAICTELNAPPEFVDLVGHHLLRVDIKRHSNGNNDLAPKSDESKMQGLVDLMVLVFLKCTEQADGIVITVDDAHLADKMSWKVLQRLFETVPNILIICTSRPLSSYNLAVDDGFWNDLQSRYAKDGRFIAMKIGLLSEYDVRILISKTLNIAEDHVSGKLHHAVFTQSGGMPQYANEILQSIKKHANEILQGLKKERTSRRRASFGGFGETTSYESLGDLMLSRVDGFSASVRYVLNLGAVLGESFRLVEIMDIMHLLHGKFFDDNADAAFLHVKQAQGTLQVAVDEGVLYMEYEGGAEDDLDHSSLTGAVPFTPRPSESMIEEISYSFCHDVWRSSLLDVMLASQKRETHRTIALMLESRQDTEQLLGFLSQTRLFNHWRESGDFVKASSVALLVGTDFVSLGLYDQSIQILQDAIGMLTLTESMHMDIGDEEASAISRRMFDTLTVDEVAGLIKLHVALGKCLATIYDVAGSVLSYEAALEVFEGAKAAPDLKDRSIAFPIFSGLYIALKFGHIKQDQECTYEQNLVVRFVEETELNGNPVHFARALAMEGEMYARLGDFNKALAAHNRLSEVYVAEEHHEPMSQAYGSDRGAQSFACSTVWFVVLGRTEEARKTCHFIVAGLMPKMDPRNVHNAFVMLYPVIFIMKENGLESAEEGRALYEHYFGANFQQYYGDGGRTFSLPLYEPIMICFDLCTRQEEEFPEFQDYLEWALDEDNLRLGPVLNNATACYGRMADAICAEICLLVAKRVEKGRDKEQLVRVALELAEESRILAAEANAVASLQQIAQMTKELEVLATDLGVLMNAECVAVLGLELGARDTGRESC